MEHRVDYEPGESTTGLFGGNSNWRGPIWFPVNYLLVESLQKFHHYFGDDFKVEFPTGSGKMMTLWEVAGELSRRMTNIFLQDQNGRRPVFGNLEKFQTDPHWRDLILFHEYFHGDSGAGVGASHQTGWTGVVTKLMQQSGESRERSRDRRKRSRRLRRSPQTEFIRRNGNESNSVFPGKPNSVHLADVPKPSLDQVPDGRGVLVKVLRVGVDGTDKEINAAEYGAAPPGYDFLIIGHEGFGRVEAVGPNVTEVKPGDYVVATVRRPGKSIYDLIGTNDMTTDEHLL